MPPTRDDIPSLSHRELAEHLRLARVNPGPYAELREALEREQAVRSPATNYRCPKCGHDRFERSEIRTARSALSSLFNVQSARYTAVVCRRCAFTEFYQGQVSAGAQVLDLIVGS